MSRSVALGFDGVLLSAVLLAIAAPCTARAEGWNLWQTTETTQRSPHYTRTSSSSAPSSSWSMTRALSNSWKATTDVSKKAWKSTVDVVTLKPLRTSKPKQSQFQLGSHPAIPSQSKPKQSMFGSLFAPKKPSGPSTVDEYFSQERPR
ncbi:MAG: hypothetical protein C0483_06750 [Pirellula sp.]|nr:hypothetical protein [Pirellula sp.]